MQLRRISIHSVLNSTREEMARLAGRSQTSPAERQVDRSVYAASELAICQQGIVSSNELDGKG